MQRCEETNFFAKIFLEFALSRSFQLKIRACAYFVENGIIEHGAYLLGAFKPEPMLIPPLIGRLSNKATPYISLSRYYKAYVVKFQLMITAAVFLSHCSWTKTGCKIANTFQQASFLYSAPVRSLKPFQCFFAF